MNVFQALFLFAVVANIVLAAPWSKTPKCGENEEFLKCGTSCEASCVEGMVMFCTKQCVVDVCQCKHGFYRNKDKKCIPKNKC